MRTTGLHRPTGPRRQTNALTLLPTMVAEVRHDLARADATAIGQIVAVSGLAALIGQIGAALPRLVLLLVGAAAVPATAVLVFASLTLWARGTRTQTPPLGSWVHILRAGPDAALAYRQATASDVQLSQLRALAPIAFRKFASVRRGWTSLWITLAALLVALIAGYVGFAL